MLRMFKPHLLVKPVLELITVCEVRVIFKLRDEIIEVVCEAQIIEYISKLLKVLRFINRVLAGDVRSKNQQDYS